MDRFFLGGRFLGGGRENDIGKIRELLKPPPSNFKPSKHSSGQTGDDPIKKVTGIAMWFNKKPEIPVVVDVVDTKVDDEAMKSAEEEEAIGTDELTGEEILANGPLTETHEFVFCIYFGTPQSDLNRAVLREKEPEPSAGRVKTSRDKKTTIRERKRGRGEPRGPRVRPTTKKDRRKDRAANRKRSRGKARKKGGPSSVTLKTFDEWKLQEGTDDEQLIIVHSISPKEFRYRDESLKLYTLKRRSESLYAKTENGDLALSPKEEEEKEEEEEEEEDESHFFPARPETARQRYKQLISGKRVLKKKESEEEGDDGEANGRTFNATTAGRRSARDAGNRSRRPSKEEFRKATETFKSIEKSEKFKNMKEKDKKDFQKLQKMLGGRK